MSVPELKSLFKTTKEKRFQYWFYMFLLIDKTSTKACDFANNVVVVSLRLKS